MNTFLTDAIPAKARKYVYALLALAALVYAALQANDGDWGQTIGSVIVTLAGFLAVSNTDVHPEPPAPPAPPVDDEDQEDDALPFQ